MNIILFALYGVLRSLNFLPSPAKILFILEARIR
nr:MAG TPA: hypothetical protein [Caudoviricetes sp.]